MIPLPVLEHFSIITAFVLLLDRCCGLDRAIGTSKSQAVTQRQPKTSPVRFQNLKLIWEEGMKHLRLFGSKIPVASFILVLLIGVPLSAVPRQEETAPQETAAAYRAEKLARLRGETFVCGTTLDGSTENRYVEELYRHERNLKRLERLRQRGFQPQQATINTDVGDLAVIEDDGTLVMPPNPFDLENQAILYTPNPTGGYDVSLTTEPLDTELGTKVTGFTGSEVPLDDGFTRVTFAEGFRFTFFGVTYDNAFISTNGNVTFRRGDANPEPDLFRFLSRSPRVAALWTDLDLTPIASGTTIGIFVRQLADRLVVSYRNIPRFGRNSERNTFQITLFADGRIIIVYSRMRTRDGLAGISPGTNVPRNQIDFSMLPQVGLIGAILESFRSVTEVDLFSVPGVFYRTHGDDFDFIYLWTDFDFDLGGAFAFYAGVRNQDQGIGVSSFDRGDSFGSPQRLQGFMVMNDIVGAYPADPNAHVFGLNSALSILGQEQGHRWLSFINYTGPDPTILLGRQEAHWSFFFNIESTSAFSSPVMPRSSSAEGNVWIDNGNGTFSTPSNQLIDGYSALDQYLMGLRASQEVPDTFVITNPTLQFSRGASPRSGVTTGGTRLNVSIDQIIQANGPRVPGVETSQKEFRAVFILLVQQGRPPAQSTLDKLNLFRTSWEEYFNRAVDSRGRLSTRLSN
jgi:hypothetical protein